MKLGRILGAVGVALVGLVVIPERPAAAGTYEVTLKPNATYELHNPKLLPPITLPLDFAYGIYPADCQDDGTFGPLCDVFHLKLDVPKAQLTDPSYFYSLTATLEWPGENIIVPAVGNFSTSQFGMSIWDNPVVEDEDGATECDQNDPIVNYYMCFVLGPSGGGDPGGDEPYFPIGGLAVPYLVTSPLPAAFIPKKDAFSLIVFNYYGLPADYTIKITLTEIKPGQLVDLSIEEFTDLSAAPSDVANTGSPLPSLDVGVTPDSGFDLGLGSGAADADLSAALDEEIAGLDRTAADIIRGRGIRTVRAPGDEQPIFVVLWLIGLPVAVGAAAAWWFLRRRASIFTT